MPKKPVIALIVTLLAATVAAFVALKVRTMAPRFSDEHTYAYMGRLIADGAVPYRDFYLSSPPLLPYVFALIGAVFAWQWQAFLLTIPIAGGAASALIIARLAAGRGRIWAAPAAAALFFGSFCALATTDFASDTHAVTLALLVGLAVLAAKRPGWAGIAWGLAALIKVYAVVPVAGVLAALAIQRRWRDLGRVAVGFSATFGAVFGGFWLAVGRPVIEQVVINNLSRTPGLDRAAILAFFAGHDPLLTGLAFLAPLAALFLARRAPADGWSVPAVGMLAALGVFYASYQDLYYLYLLPGGALTALLGARAFGRIALGLALAAGAYGVHRYLGEQADAAVIAGLPDIVARVQALTRDGEPIYGEFELTPLVALLAGRPIAGNFVDTNLKFFNQGLFNFDERAAAVQRAGARLIIAKAVVDQQGRVVSGLERVLRPEFFTAHCQVAAAFPIPHDYSANAVLLLTCDH